MTTVLTLHRVVEHPEEDHDLSWDSFRRLMDSLSVCSTALDRPSPRQVAVTFDDGTEDHLPTAEELQQRGLSATFFIVAGQVGGPGRLDGRQLQELVSMGHTVGSHALDHRPLARISPQQLRYQVRESRLRLEEICETPVVFFAPPGGIGHPGLVPALKSELFLACRSMRWGLYQDPGQRWDIPCIPVTEYTWQKGWIAHAMARHSLPFAMRLGRAVKAALPDEVTRSIRGALHARLRR